MPREEWSTTVSTMVGNGATVSDADFGKVVDYLAKASRPNRGWTISLLGAGAVKRAMELSGIIEGMVVRFPIFAVLALAVSLPLAASSSGDLDYLTSFGSARVMTRK